MAAKHWQQVYEIRHRDHGVTLSVYMASSFPVLCLTLQVPFELPPSVLRSPRRVLVGCSATAEEDVNSRDVFVSQTMRVRN